MNKYFLTLQGRWQLSAHLEINASKWGIGLHVQGHGPGVDPTSTLFAEVVLTLGPITVDAQADLLTEDHAALTRDLLDGRYE